MGELGTYLAQAGFLRAEVEEKLQLVREALDVPPPSTNLHTPLETRRTTPNIPTTSQEPSQGDWALVMRRLQQMEEELRSSREEVARVRAAAALGPAPAPQPAVMTQAPKQRLKHPEPFAGNRKDYRAFRQAARYKLLSDNYDDVSAVSYVFNCLTGAAARSALTWIENNPDRGMTALWGHLDSLYVDTMKEERARFRLHNIRQGKEGIVKFNQLFEEVALEAGEREHESMLKNRYLMALSPELADRMVTIDLPESASLREIMGKVERISNNLYRNRVGQAQLKAQTRRANTAPPETMDWEPTGARPGRVGSPETTGSTTQKQARWATKEQRRERKKKGQCLRCGTKGHFVDKCNLLPAQRPAGARQGSLEEVNESPSEEENTDNSEN
jgi:hypothetical protein